MAYEPDRSVKAAASPGREAERRERLHGLELRARLDRVAAWTGVPPTDVEALSAPSPLSFEAADRMVENAIGVLGVPLGVALNVRVNGRDRVVPMAVEEPSVIAAASLGADLVRRAGGFQAQTDPPHMIGQIQLVDVPDPEEARRRIEAAESRILAEADAVHPAMARRGAGARGIEVRMLPTTPCGPMVVVHLLVEVGDAMGANAVNSMVEAVAPTIQTLARGTVRLRILSNLADRRLARASAALPLALLGTAGLDGADVARRIVEAWAFADADPYRATTHNKGIMNGVDAVALATGNDWRGIEAGAHAYAARTGRYRPLTTWSLEDQALVGTLELPLAVGIVGGSLALNPRARLALELVGAQSGRDLAEVMAAVGLGQNLAALRALVTVGIQRGHMALHARGLVLAVGAPPELRDTLTRRLVESGTIKLAKARELLAAARAGEVT